MMDATALAPHCAAKRRNDRANPPAVDLATDFKRCKYLNLPQENARACGSGLVICYIYFVYRPSFIFKSKLLFGSVIP